MRLIIPCVAAMTAAMAMTGCARHDPHPGPVVPAILTDMHAADRALLYQGEHELRFGELLRAENRGWGWLLYFVHEEYPPTLQSEAPLAHRTLAVHHDGQVHIWPADEVLREQARDRD